MVTRRRNGDTITVLDHTTALMQEADKRYQQRFDAQTVAINAALLAAEKAVTKAEVAADKRFELLNELRAGVATRGEIEALEKLVTTLEKRLQAAESHKSGVKDSWGYLIGAVGLIGLIISIFIAIN